LDRVTDTRKLTLTATLAAVYVIFRAIPISKLIGISGSITAAGMIAPVLGILLEPAYGIVAVFTGTMVASLFPWNPLIFGGLDFVPGALNVTLVSLAVRGRRVEATIMFLITIGLFMLNPYTRLFVGSALLSPPIPYLWMHIAALIVLISPLSKNLIVKLNSSQPRIKMKVVTRSWRDIRSWPSLLLGLLHQNRGIAGAVAILAFTGTMIEHLTGGLLFATVVGKGALKFWPLIFLAYPIERTVLVVGATLIGVALLRLLRPTLIESSLEPVKQVGLSPVRSVPVADQR
jgi:hypothetical protein